MASNNNDIFDMTTKQLRINIVGDSETIELGCTNWNKRMQNELNDFAKPSLSEGETERRIQNLNQVEEVHVFKTLVNDEFIRVSDVISDTYTTKEDIEEQFDTFFKQRRLVRLRYGHIDVNGYLTEFSVEEASQNDNSTFMFDFTLLVGIPMSGNQ